MRLRHFVMSHAFFGALDLFVLRTRQKPEILRHECVKDRLMAVYFTVTKVVCRKKEITWLWNIRTDKEYGTCAPRHLRHSVTLLFTSLLIRSRRKYTFETLYVVVWPGERVSEQDSYLNPDATFQSTVTTSLSKMRYGIFGILCITLSGANCQSYCDQAPTSTLRRICEQKRKIDAQGIEVSVEIC